MQEMYSLLQTCLRECVRQLTQQVLISNVIKPLWYWCPLWFLDTDLGITCRDSCDKWRHLTADQTAWKYHFRCWSRARAAGVISFLTVYIAKTCSVSASWSDFPPDLFLWWLHERVTAVTRTDAWFWSIFHYAGAENFVFEFSDDSMRYSLKLAFLDLDNYMQQLLLLSSCSLCSAFGQAVRHFNNKALHSL